MNIFVRANKEPLKFQHYLIAARQITGRRITDMAITQKKITAHGKFKPQHKFGVLDKKTLKVYMQH